MPWAMGTLQGSKGRLLLLLTESMDSGKKSSPYPFHKGQQEAPGVVSSGAGACWGEKPGQFVLVLFGTQKQDATTARALNGFGL